MNFPAQHYLIVGLIWIVISCRSWTTHVKLQGYPLKSIVATEPKNTTTLFIKNWEKNQLSLPTLSARQQIYIAQTQKADSLSYQRYLMQGTQGLALPLPSYIATRLKKVNHNKLFGHTNTVGSTLCLKRNLKTPQ